ncbi:hypothetical protein [Streptomyces sp. TP-A0874]|uniref:hypothetical protein n=1 Tax=Streptomyces sp. TP-A0874 TaxID=549819 RepID=UPI0008529CA5|nr:hypothetical protein [Streptomyces sp. TP-A0874]
MAGVILTIVLVFVLFLGIGGYLAARLARAAGRQIDRTVSQTRRAVEDATLKARQYSRPGPAGEVAQLRVELRTSMRATREALDAAAPTDPSLSEALDLYRRLSHHGHELDEELKRLENEPDRSGLGERLPGLRKRTQRVTHSADSLRWAIQDRARRFAEDDLSTLGSQIDLEVDALRHWTPTDGPKPESASPGPEGRSESEARRAESEKRKKTDPPRSEIPFRPPWNRPSKSRRPDHRPENTS